MNVYVFTLAFSERMLISVDDLIVVFFRGEGHSVVILRFGLMVLFDLRMSNGRSLP